MGILGLCATLIAAYALSSNRSKVRHRIVAWGLGLQLLMAVLVLRTPFGLVFDGLGQTFRQFVLLAEEGSFLVFGDLGRSANGVILAFQILPLIIVVSTISAILYHFRILPKIVAVLAFLMQRGMKSSGAESLSVAANLFLGQAEAPLTIRPYLAKMTRSEIMTVMTGGMATVSGAILIAYVQLGAANAENLLMSLLMTAPTCIMMAKIMEPETGVPETLGSTPKQADLGDRNFIDAASRGANEGLTVALHVGAILIAFVGIVGVLNGTFSAIRDLLGVSWFPGSIQAILGPPFAIVAAMLGVAWEDASTVGSLLGTRMVLNEFISYAELATIKDTLRPESFLITNYALCGFANVGSVGIQIAALGAIAPVRRGELAALGFRAMIAATLSNFSTASMAGLIAFTPLLDL